MTIRSAFARVLAPLFALGLLGVSHGAAAATPAAFTAHYSVSQGGMPMGEATVTLRPAGNDEWIYRTEIKGTSGLAALLGASTTETSRFRWKGDIPEAISYDYQLVAAGKHKQRHLVVDWATHRATMDEGKGPHAYPTTPGLVERNTTALALGLALRNGQRQITLPVAVRQAVETQHFAVTGKQPVKVAAGSFDAERVDRSDAQLGFSAWYVPTRYPVPVKLAQRDGGDLLMQLVSYSQP